MSDSEAIALEFKKWKGNLTHCRYPQHLWEEIYQLKDRYPLEAIAAALGTTPCYLKRKFSKWKKPVTFASVQVTSSPVRIEFRQMTFHASEHQIPSLIQELIRA
jgi:hypothetical protein